MDFLYTLLDNHKVDKLKAYRQEYHRKNARKIIARSNKYRIENAEKMSAYQKRYREEHAEKLKLNRCEKVYCDWCGIYLNKGNMPRHKRSVSHRNNTVDSSVSILKETPRHGSVAYNKYHNRWVACWYDSSNKLHRKSGFRTKVLARAYVLEHNVKYYIYR